MTNCGTDAGYYRHYKENTRRCQPCKDAHAAAGKARKYRAANPDKLARLTQDEADQAACIHANPKEFYPEQDDGINNRYAYAQAKTVCGECPIRVRCLEVALLNREEHGVWGGKSPEERKTILKNRASITCACGARLSTARGLQVHQGRYCPERDAA